MKSIAMTTALPPAPTVGNEIEVTSSLQSCQTLLTGRPLSKIGSDSSIWSGSPANGKSNQEVDLSCWQTVEADQSDYSHGHRYNTPLVVMIGFPSNVPSTGLPEKIPVGERQAVSAAAAWNAGGNWPNWPLR